MVVYEFDRAGNIVCVLSCDIIVVVFISWELDVRGQVSTKKWLSNYGLKKNKLDIKSLMQAVGFKKRDGLYLLSFEWLNLLLLCLRKKQFSRMKY